MIEFNCEHCGQTLKVRDDSAAGKSGTCQHCNRSITVPTAEQLERKRVTAENLRLLGLIARTLAGFALVVVLVRMAGLSFTAANPPAPAIHVDRFQSNYADPAGTNALESIETHVDWFVRYGTSDLRFWLIVIAGLLVLQLVQFERLLIQSARQRDRA